MNVHVIPTKAGMWRVVYVSDEPAAAIEGAVRLSRRMFALWEIAYRRWWATKGNRLAISPEMWQ